jgi:hypothetical protein
MHYFNKYLKSQTQTLKQKKVKLKKPEQLDISDGG